MSLSQVQKLAAQTVVAVSEGRNLADELAALLRAHPDLSPQDKGMLQDLAYGVQRYAGSLKIAARLKLAAHQWRELDEVHNQAFVQIHGFVQRF